MITVHQLHQLRQLIERSKLFSLNVRRSGSPNEPIQIHMHKIVLVETALIGEIFVRVVSTKSAAHIHDTISSSHP